MRVLYLHTHASAFGSCRGNRLAGCIQQFQLHIAAAFQFELHIQGTVLVGLIQIGRHTDVLNAFFVAGIQIAIASYATEAEEVLVFQICAVAPAEYLESNQVRLSRLQVRGQVKFRLQLAVFTIAYITAVHPKIHIGSDRTEMCDNIFSFPACRNNNLTTV